MGGTRRRRRDRKEGRLLGVARSLGSAAGWVRRLGRRHERAPAEPAEPRAPLRLFGAAQPDRPDTPVLARLRRRRERVQDAIAGLEQELEELHAAIGGGVRSAGGHGPAALQARIRRARELRDELHERELDLARVDQHIAREEQLAELGAPPGREPSSAPRPRRPTAEPDAEDGALAKRRRVVRAAVRKAAFDDRVQEVRIERLADQLCDADEELRRDAARALASLGHPVALDLLLTVVGDDSERVRLTALNALARWDDAGVAKVFRRFLRDDNAHVRTAALRGLDADVSGAELVDALEDPEPDVRKTAATMLGWRPPTEAVPALCFALRDDDAVVRRAAAASLGNLADHRAVLALIRSLDDPDDGVRRAVDGALVRTVGRDVEAVGEGLPPAERMVELKRWWETVRVDKTMERMGMTAPARPLPATPSPVEPTAVAEAEEPAAAFEEHGAEEEKPAAAFEEHGAEEEEPAAAFEEQEEDFVDLGLGGEEDAEGGEGFESLFGEEEEEPAAAERDGAEGPEGKGEDAGEGEDDDGDSEEYESIL